MPNNRNMDREAFLRKLGNNVRRLCQAKKFKQERVGLEAGFSIGTMSKITNGHSDVKIYTLYRIAETIGVSLEELVKID